MSAEQRWVAAIVAYKDQLPADHPDQEKNVFAVTEAMRQDVLEQFGGLSKLGAVESLARWLIDEHGRNMRYDVKANFTPIEAYKERRGNCLSFTMLLHSLAQELGIDIEYNSVDIPDTWDMDENLGVVFYRHVNGVFEAYGQRKIFDLAMELYDTGYPQKFVSKTQVMAMWMNNLAIGHLEKQNFTEAFKAIKLSVSYDPKNADLWVNLGVIKKRDGDLHHAEVAFLKAYELDRYSVVAVSNLERLYRELGKTAKAAKFAKQAKRARLSNPYAHYQKALYWYNEEAYKKASRANRRAIELHDEDPRFYELQSLIAQQRGQYIKALKALEKAYINSSRESEREKYVSKVELVTRNALREAKEQQKTKVRGRIYRADEINRGSLF